MFIYEAYEILGIEKNSCKEDIKKAYKDIALSCHPDKLGKIDDEVEKNLRIEKFKTATIAYEILINNTNENKCWNDKIDWKEIWYSFFKDDINTKEIIKDTIYDIANHFVNSKIYPRNYYNPPSTSNIDVIKHEVKLEVTYNDILINNKKKIRLILVGINEPIYIEVYCGTSFPEIVKEYTDDNDTVHDIKINIEIKKEENWDHIISKKGCVDIITNIDINIKDYITGYDKDIKYINNTIMKIKIPPFQKELYEIQYKGLNGGSMIVNINILYIEKDKWMLLEENKKESILRIMELLL